MSTPINEVPWMIENGAKHTVQVARNLSYMAAGGTEGIVRGAHLEVRETAVPGPQVRVFPGTAAIQNRAAGAADEMYVLRVANEETVDIAPTGGAGRSDLIVARIENPWASGETWPDPSDPTVGPYASLAVISNVGSGVNSADDLGLLADNSMLALARIDLPANTTTVTQDMIVDLRKMSGSVSKTEFEVFTPTVADALTSASYVRWPDTAYVDIDIPEWATHARLRAILASVAFGGSGASNVIGDLRFRVGGVNGDILSSSTRYNLDNDAGVSRPTIMAAAPKVPLPKTDRGTHGVRFEVQGKKNSGNTNLSVDDHSTITFEVVFLNEPESNV